MLFVDCASVSAACYHAWNVLAVCMLPVRKQSLGRRSDGLSLSGSQRLGKWGPRRYELNIKLLDSIAHMPLMQLVLIAELGDLLTASWTRLCHDSDCFTLGMRENGTLVTAMILTSARRASSAAMSSECSGPTVHQSACCSGYVQAAHSALASRSPDCGRPRLNRVATRPSSLEWDSSSTSKVPTRSTTTS